MHKRNKVLVIGSKPPPINGQSIAFESAVKALKPMNDIQHIHTLFRANNFIDSILVALIYFFKVAYTRFFYRPSVVYFLSSRSFIGSIRDAFLILVYYFSNAKIINHLHGSNFNEFIEKLPFFYRIFLIFLYKRVNKHIILHKCMKDQLTSIKNINNKVVIIPNFYEDIADKSVHLIKKKKYNPEPISLVYISAICTSKGIFDLIESCKLLSKNGVSYNLTIAGEGMDDSILNAEAVIKKLKNIIQDIPSINYIGIVHGKDKYRLLGNSHIFILPSYYDSEAFPLSIIEAMRMGCAIITTSYKYLPYLVKNDLNGFLVEQMNPNDICEKISSLFKNTDTFERISRYNISNSEKLYSEDIYQANICKHVK